jgi:hypothetical protein
VITVGIVLGVVQIITSIKINAMLYVQAVVFKVLAHSKEYAMEAVNQDGQGINAMCLVHSIVSKENVTQAKNVLYV